VNKLLIIIGAILVIIGFLWPWLGKIPFGRLPGDIIVSKPNLKFYFPITTMVIISIVLSVILWLLKK
jgi:hypothetical protein